MSGLFTIIFVGLESSGFNYACFKFEAQVVLNILY